MRIAISGTHCMGKTTFGQDFVRAHPNFRFEAEPYHQLEDDHGVEFAEEPTADGMVTQLDFSIDLINNCTHPDVIFDRCPADFFAYIQCITKRSDEDPSDYVKPDKVAAAREALARLDMIVFLPIVKGEEVEDEVDEEVRSFRKAADRAFREVYHDEIFPLFPNHQIPHIIEISGSRKERVRKLSAFLR